MCVCQKMQWVNKYRPFQLTELVGQTLVKKACENVLSGKDDLLNMLFKGPPGTGKSCAIDILCRGLFGDELMRERVFQISATDERGINMVREKIKFFSSLKVRGSKSAKDHLCPDLKMVVIDEVDNLTFDAQTALRNVIETSSRSTRFCIICIDDSKIIDPIKSRCLLFPFGKLLPVDIVFQLERINAREKLGADFEFLSSISKRANGDLRKAVNMLQTCFSTLSPLSGHRMFCDITGSDISFLRNDENPLTVAERFLISGGNPQCLLERLSCNILQSDSSHESLKRASILTRTLCRIQIGLNNGCEEAISIAYALTFWPRNNLYP